MRRSARSKTGETTKPLEPSSLLTLQPSNLPTFPKSVWKQQKYQNPLNTEENQTKTKMLRTIEGTNKYEDKKFKKRKLPFCFKTTKFFYEKN